jgi:hypothetical protein
VASQTHELREREIGITPFDCPRDNWWRSSCTSLSCVGSPSLTTCAASGTPVTSSMACSRVQMCCTSTPTDSMTARWNHGKEPHTRSGNPSMRHHAVAHGGLCLSCEVRSSMQTAHWPAFDCSAWSS